MLPGQTEQRGLYHSTSAPLIPCLCPPQAWPAPLTPSVSSMVRRAHGVSNYMSTAPSWMLRHWCHPGFLLNAFSPNCRRDKGEVHGQPRAWIPLHQQHSG